MNDMSAPLESNSDSEAQRTLRVVALIGILSIALGFGMQGLILAIKLAGGAPFPGAKLFADIAQGVTWSFLVCAGIGIGTAIAKARAVIVGAIGLVCAPVAMAFAKSSQKVVSSVVGVPEQEPLLSFMAISGMRAVEYGLLGYMLASLARKDISRARTYLGAGAAIGVFFGGSISAMTYNSAIAKGIELPAAQLIGTILNEVLFPVGCAAIIYVSLLITRNIRAITAPD